MDFERRAQKALDRGEPVRAVVALAEGLKRRPDRESALETMLETYTRRVQRPGLEQDVAAVLAEQPDAQHLMDQVYSELVRRERDSMARDFERAVRDRGFETPEGVEPQRAVSSSAVREAAVASDDGSEQLHPESTGAGERGEGIEAEHSESAAAVGAGDSDPAVAREPEDTEPRASIDEESDGESVANPERPTRRDRSSRVTPWRAAHIGIFLVVFAAILAAVWQFGFAAGREVVEAGPLRSLDPSEPGVVDRAREWGFKAGLGKEAARERSQFVRAIRSLEAGRSISFDGEPTTPWGRSARAIAALSRDDVAEAVRAETRLQRSDAAGGLATLWTSGRVAEYRGRVEAAARLYDRVTSRFPEFVPAIAGAMRMAFSRLDSERLERLAALLRSRTERHPYLSVERIGMPSRDRSTDEAEESNTADADQGAEVADLYDSAFLEDVRTYDDARGALRAGRYQRAFDRATEVVERRPNFGPALWVRALASAARFEVEQADRDFGRIVELPKLSQAYRWRLVVAAPTALAAAGRPDLAAKYMLPGTGPVSTQPPASFSAEKGASDEDRPRIQLPKGSPEAVVSRASKWKFDPAEASVDRAIVERAHLVRIRLMLELGRFARARRLFAGLPSIRELEGSLRLLRAEADARRGRRPAGPKDWAWESAGLEARLVDAYYSGRYETSVEVGERLLKEGGGTVRAARFVALSHAAMDRGRRARSSLAKLEFEPWVAPAVERVRDRIIARVASGDTGGSVGGDGLRTVTPTSSSAAVDRAALHLWNHEIEQAAVWSETAVARAPDFPEGNWFHGIVLRLQGERSSAERYLRRAWGAQRGGARLALELGYVHFALEQYEEARDRFFRALLAAPESVEAIRGLGRAYYHYDRDQGRWNFERILENYEGASSRAVQAAEVLRWLAVFHGSREGDPAGRPYLKRARARAGDQAILLLEEARRLRASGDIDGSRQLFVEALEKDSTLAAAHLGLAKIARTADNDRASRRHLRRYLSLDPRGEASGWARSKLEELQRTDEKSEGTGSPADP